MTPSTTRALWRAVKRSLDILSGFRGHEPIRTQHQHRQTANTANYCGNQENLCIGLQQIEAECDQGRKDQADKAMDTMRSMMGSLKLTVNDDKTHLCRVPQERFDFLGYTFGRCYNRETGRAYIGTRPSKKSIKRMVDSITEETDHGRGW